MPAAAGGSGLAVQLTDGWQLGARWVVGSGALLLPLAISPLTYDQFVLPRMALTRLMVVLLLALWLGRTLTSGSLVVRPTPLDLPLLAGVASAALSTLVAVNRDVAVFGAYLRDGGLLTICTYALLYWLVSQTLTDPAEVRSLVGCLLAGAYLVALLAVLQSLLAGRLTTGVETAQTFGGWVRVSGTFGNPLLLGTYLAMLLPLALDEAMQAGAGWRRLLGANVVVASSVALLLTFSRAAWLGAAAGVLVTMAPRVRRAGVDLRVAAGGAVAVVTVAAAAVAHAGPPLLTAVAQRAASLSAPLQGSGGARLDIWRDALAMVAARPLLGWGPDTFGLVYPQFRSGPGMGVVVDEAHMDLLQVAATQGLLGAAAWALTLGALALAFWRGRRAAGAFAMLGGVLAYEVNVLFAFSWVPVTALFWILAAAAVATWSDPRRASDPIALTLPGWAGVWVGAVSALALPAAVVVLVAAPVLADASSLRGLAAQRSGDRSAAHAWLHQARRLAPEEATYAAEVGDADLDLRPDGRPGARADWLAARDSYTEAVRLGTTEPVVYERLALADQALGRFADADVAIRTADRLAGRS